MFKGTGKRITETRPLTAFNKIYLEDNVNIIITPGNYYEAKVEAGEKLIPLIHTKVDSGTLILSNDNRCNWARSYKKGIINVYVTMPTLRFIWHYGSGNITCSDTIHCDTINVQTRETGNIDLTLDAHIVYGQFHGSSDVTLHGKAPLMGLYHVGEGYFYAEDLQTDEIWTHSNASGDEKLNAKKVITAKLFWAGSIYYTGNPPQVNSEIKGSGKLIPY